MLESCFRCAHVERLAPATSSDKPLNYTSILFSLNQTCFLHVYFLHDSATGTDGGNDNTGREISERPLFCSMERAHRKRNRTSNDQRKPITIFIDENLADACECFGHAIN